jgi:uncharacterized membrane protein YpjA
MRALARELLFAFLAWLMPFAASFAIFPLKKSHLPLFESLIAVILAASTVALGCLYFRRVSRGFQAQGLKIGLFWMAANWALDAPMFGYGPMKISLAQYVMDIGVTYLMIPVITLGLGTVATAVTEGRDSIRR